ncbi:MAG: signal peptidase I [Gammaproteobacteria bacterium]|nr:signal peptidase I [Gammaproteobacteria bacterium]MXX95864.1 signal peptidase I [Gammaproteobacteria bacterium]MYF52568.1 signal peptidase I [Gammaproteobacteria bacterium]MYK44271.1 signal peptidase I [Gammaproteobacteria bacterium]
MNKRPTQSPNRNWKTRLKNIWVGWRSLLIFIVLMLIFRSVFADWNHVPTGSMNPGIIGGDRVVVDKIAYDIRWPFSFKRIFRWSDPNRGDIVTVDSPEEDQNQLLIKRVIGVPGDTVELRQNRLIINATEATYVQVTEDEVRSLNLPPPGNDLYFWETIFDEVRIVKWIPRHTSRDSSFGPITLGTDEYFIMGDNRDNSRDSRRIGLIERDRIIGRAHTIAFSIDFKGHDGIPLRPRFRRFFTYLL